MDEIGRTTLEISTPELSNRLRDCVDYVRWHARSWSDGEVQIGPLRSAERGVRLFPGQAGEELGIERRGAGDPRSGNAPSPGRLDCQPSPRDMFRGQGVDLLSVVAAGVERRALHVVVAAILASERFPERRLQRRPDAGIAERVSIPRRPPTHMPRPRSGRLEAGHGIRILRPSVPAGRTGALHGSGWGRHSGSRSRSS